MRVRPLVPLAETTPRAAVDAGTDDSGPWEVPASYSENDGEPDAVGAATGTGSPARETTAVTGPGHPAFEAAMAAIPAGIRTLLADRLRADFKYLRALRPEDLGMKPPAADESDQDVT